jgi:orotidine-5'-phosphate decarboxylase
VVNGAGFRRRITNASKLKRSRIILALDTTGGVRSKEIALKTISQLQEYICAIKLNHHLILPLSKSDLAEINRLAHSHGLQSIADLKLNDIPSTNKIAISLALSMGFDALTVNPFIGRASLRSAVEEAHRSLGGLIGLVYMSHSGAREGFGINFINRNTDVEPFYQKFFRDAIACHVDGVIVGANRMGVLRKLSLMKRRIPIYSPGIGVQGGDLKRAAARGVDYFVIGRSIIRSKDPINTIKRLYRHIRSV